MAAAAIALCRVDLSTVRAPSLADEALVLLSLKKSSARPARTHLVGNEQSQIPAQSNDSIVYCPIAESTLLFVSPPATLPVSSIAFRIGRFQILEFVGFGDDFVGAFPTNHFLEQLVHVPEIG